MDKDQKTLKNCPSLILKQSSGLLMLKFDIKKRLLIISLDISLIDSVSPENINNRNVIKTYKQILGNILSTLFL